MPNVPPVNTITRSVTQFITSALRLVGALRSGIGLTNTELMDCAQVANDMLDAWGIERVMVFTVPYTLVDQNGAALVLQAGKQKYILGNALGTEDFLIARPPRIDLVSVLYNSSQSTPVELAMEMMTDGAQWQAISNKSTPSLLPQVCYIEAATDGLHWNLYFWPTPTQANNVALYPWAALSQFPNLLAQFQFPPGYAEAIRYNLAVRLAAEFPCDLQKFAIVKGLAKQAYDRIAGFNAPVKIATCDPALVTGGSSLGNIYTDTPNRNRDN